MTGRRGTMSFGSVNTGRLFPLAATPSKSLSGRPGEGSDKEGKSSRKCKSRKY